MSPSRTVRLFLSSTFRDMQLERDYLCHVTFPRIEQFCKSRHIHFSVVDLRWGITTEASQNDRSVGICLEELKRCQPFVIALLGERYGWIPSARAITVARIAYSDSEAIERLGNTNSITELEIDCAIQLARASNVGPFVYLRDRQLTDELAKLDGSIVFVEEEPTRAERLSKLKGRLRKEPLVQIANYASIFSLGQKIERDIVSRIGRQFPANLAFDADEIRQEANAFVCQQLARGYVPSDAQEVALDEASNNRTPVFVVSGGSGTGKTSLLAYWQPGQSGAGARRTIKRFIGLDGAASLEATLQQVVDAMSGGIAAYSTLETPHQSPLERFSEAIRQNTAISTCIVLDGIANLSMEEQKLKWLPDQIGLGITVVLGVSSESPAYIVAKQRKYAMLEMGELSSEIRKAVVVAALNLASKRLGMNETVLIANSRACANVAFLKIFLNELVVAGSHETLASRILDAENAQTIENLFQRVLIRLEMAHGFEFVKQVTGAMAMSASGLTDNELLSLAGQNRVRLSGLV